MLYPLDALTLFAPAVRAAVSVSPVAPRSPVFTDCPVAARSAGDTARSGGGEGKTDSGGSLTVAKFSPS